MEHKLRNQIISHRILNYLNAGYQGKFTALNILSRLQVPEFNPDDIKVTKDGLREINTWLDELWDGQTLFKEELEANQTEAARQAFRLLSGLQPELERLATDLYDILYANPERDVTAMSAREVAVLIAAYGRNAYSRDNYVRGFIKFGQVFSDRELLKVWEPHLEEVNDNVKLANEFLQTFRENPKQEPNFYQHLTFFCRTLPGVFRSHVHDIFQLNHSLIGELGFEKAGFSRPEAVDWKKKEFPVIEAGYWRAHGYSPDQAQVWKNAGVPDPLTAAEWDTAGFDVEYAIEWLALEFSPLLAIQWHAAEFTPEQASILVSRGYYYPEMIPEGKTQELLDMGYPGKDEISDQQGEGIPDDEVEQ